MDGLNKELGNLRDIQAGLEAYVTEEQRRINKEEEQMKKKTEVEEIKKKMEEEEKIDLFFLQPRICLRHLHTRTVPYIKGAKNDFEQIKLVKQRITRATWFFFEVEKAFIQVSRVMAS